VFLDDKTNSHRVGGFGWLQNIRVGLTATKAEDVSDLGGFCEYLLTTREDNSLTPVG
jgi:hypothetical protein